MKMMRIDRNLISRRRTLAGLAAFATLGVIGPARAQSARDVKATGLVGERVDGYLGLVQGGVSADIQQAVNAINAERQQVYEQTARESGRPLNEVLAVAGARLRDKAQRGDWVQDAAGQWIQKR